MKDEELNDWLRGHNERFVAQVNAEIDIEERRRLVLYGDAGGRDGARRADRSFGPTTPIPASRPRGILAILSAAACIVVTITATVFLWQGAPGDDSSSRQTPGVHGEWKITRTTPTENVDYQEVSGPANMTTMIPATWSTTSLPMSDGFEARNPDDPTQVLRYGATQSSSPPSLSSHTDYETEFSAHRENYQRIQLMPTSFHGLDAIVWDFEYDSENGRRHVVSLYWYENGYEYFIYASAPLPQWPEMTVIFSTMRAHAQS